MAPDFKKKKNWLSFKLFGGKISFSVWIFLRVFLCLWCSKSGDECLTWSLWGHTVWCCSASSSWKLWESLRHLKYLLSLFLFFYGCDVASYGAPLSSASSSGLFSLYCPDSVVFPALSPSSLMLSSSHSAVECIHLKIPDTQLPHLHLILLSTSIVFLLRLSVHLMKPFHPFFSPAWSSLLSEAFSSSFPIHVAPLTIQTRHNGLGLGEWGQDCSVSFQIHSQHKNKACGGHEEDSLTHCLGSCFKLLR